MRQLVLGVDGGGTNTVAWLGDADGQVVGRGCAGASNCKSVGVSAAFRALEQSISNAFADAAIPLCRVEVACLGLAGFGRPEDQRLLVEWADRISLARRVLPATDAALALAAGTPDGCGVAVIAGTGSIAFGCDRRGLTARAGGWGPLFGDEGSAYSVVLGALRRIARRADGRDANPFSPDPLTDHFCKRIGVTAPAGLITALYAPEVDRAWIAGLAPVVIAAAAEDPQIIGDLLEPAGRELAESVLAVLRTLGWSERVLPLALAGGFLLGAPAVSDSLKGHLERSGFELNANPVPDPVRGALVLARRTLDSSADAMAL